MEDFFLKNSPWFFLGYIVLKEIFPLLNRIVDSMIPQRVARIKSAEEKANELREREISLDEKKTDLHEREVVAWEQIGKSLAIMQTNQDDMSEKLSSIMSATNLISQSMVVLLDRDRRQRQHSVEDTQPLAPIEKVIMEQKKK